MMRIDRIWRDLGLPMASVKPAVNALGSLDAFERSKGQECTLEVLPVDRVPCLVRPAMLILKKFFLLAPLNMKTYSIHNETYVG
jgi:hypothetical protein